ncbi:MAG: hypothetical protein ACJ8AT_11930 [Hyalangium sp.]|uniref:hypothetical protein n=1 Tax=Hyalangium sp. TaxID=2028555 RepID=UPI00389AC0DC
MDKFKTVFIFTLAGALLGNWVASLIVPSYLAWNNSAPLASQQMCDLPKAIHDTSSGLIHGQLVGSGIGAVAFLVLGIVFIQLRARKQKAAQPPPAAPTPTAS